MIFDEIFFKVLKIKWVLMKVVGAVGAVGMVGGASRTGRDGSGGSGGVGLYCFDGFFKGDTMGDAAT